MTIGFHQFLVFIISAFLLFPNSSDAQLKFAGQRWVVDLDEETHVKAVYDLSYPSFLSQISLGIISEDAFDYDVVKKKVDQAIGTHSVSGQTANGFQSQPKLNWNSIPWKKTKSNLLSAQGAVTQFSLNDIDFDQTVTDRDRFQQLISEANERYRNLEIGKSSESILNAFEFIKTSNGNFELIWHPTSQEYSVPGKKISDLTWIRGGFYEMLELSALRAALGTATGLIPIPLVSALVGTAVDRFFYYYWQLYQSHQEMFLEMLAAAEQDENIFSPFKRIMTEEERTEAASYIIMGNYSALDLIKLIFFPKAPADQWNRKLNDYVDNSNLANQWLNKHQRDFKTLGSRFAIGFENSKERYLYLSSRSAPRKVAGPYVGYDDLNPDSIVLRRFSEALLSLEVSFVANSLSFVGTGLQQIYKWTVESEVEKSKYAESRLLVSLEEKQAETGEDWSRVLSKLPAQQANPMELSWDAQTQLIQTRKQRILENSHSLK